MIVSRILEYSAEVERSSGTAGWNPSDMFSFRLDTPRLLVMMTMVLEKLTALPLASLRRPSSRICNSMLKTSGCAFSISSNSTTEYGRRRTAAVS